VAGATDREIIGPGHTLGTVTDKISDVVLRGAAPRVWMTGFAVSFTLLLIGVWAIVELLRLGVGVWGLNVPVGWG
jgi:molybdopterin-containing oxidoreductase family membrane subunit